MKVQYKKFNDKISKREYQRVSPKETLAHYPYYYNKMFNDDGKMLTILEEKGIRNIWLLSPDEGELTKITNFKESDVFLDFGPQFLNPKNEIVYVVNNTVILHDIDSCKVKEIYSPSSKWETYGVPAFSTDGKYMVTMDFWSDQYVNRNNDNWQAFSEQGRKGLRTRLIRVDLHSNAVHILLDTAYFEALGRKKNQWLGHPQFMPNDPNKILYCHEGYGGTVDARMWMYDMDTGDSYCLRDQQEGEIISHEFFSSDSNKVYYVRIENDQAEVGSLRCFQLGNLCESTLVKLPRCSHFMSDINNKFLVADADRVSELWLYFVDVNKQKIIPLLKHNSSMKSYGNTQDAHPHPVFSPDNKWVYFVSDMEGYPAIYRTDIRSLTS